MTQKTPKIINVNIQVETSIMAFRPTAKNL